MKLHIVGVGNTAWKSVENGYTKVTGTPTTQGLNEKRENNQVILEIASTLSYSKFDDVKGCTTTNFFWDNPALIYGGDVNALRAKANSLRRKFDDKRMHEDETISQYCGRVNETINDIRGAYKILEDETIISKVLRIFQSIYAIRVFYIQESRCTIGNTWTLEGLIGRHTEFELSNFDKFNPRRV